MDLINIDINCSLGLSQLKKINFFERKKKIYQLLYKIKNFNEIKISNYSKNIKPSSFIYNKY